MPILGIETSCDETATAIYDEQRGLIADQVYSQIDIHEKYGGVVPELASRDHIRKLLPLIETVLQDANLKLNDLSGIAYTKGPGLMGALMVGASIGRSLGYALNIPTLGVHHLEGHVMAIMLEKDLPEFPFIALLVSGGHTMLIEVMQFGKYRVLGESLDDAVGEAFDKTAKLLGLSYPGGAALAALAEQGISGRFHFPRPMIHQPGLSFSFSGIKTYAVNCYKTHGHDQQTRADIACAFEEAIVDTLAIKCRRALEQTQYHRLVVVGGVGANKKLRTRLFADAEKNQSKIYFPRPRYCTDNAAMIAYVGWQRIRAGERDDLRIAARARWDLQELN